MLVETGNGIATRGISGTHFYAKGSGGGVCASVVMEQRVKNVESILRCLPPGKGTKFHSQKWPGFADANGKIFLNCAVEVHASHFDLAGGSQGAVDAGQDIGRGIIHHRRPLRSWR